MSLIQADHDFKRCARKERAGQSAIDCARREVERCVDPGQKFFDFLVGGISNVTLCTESLVLDPQT